MSEQIPIFFANQSLGSLANEPVQHPDAQNADKRYDFVHVKVVSHQYDHK